MAERTQRHGHNLDLVISREDNNLIRSVSVSHHFLISIGVSLQNDLFQLKLFLTGNIS